MAEARTVFETYEHPWRRRQMALDAAFTTGDLNLPSMIFLRQFEQGRYLPATGIEATLTGVTTVCIEAAKACIAETERECNMAPHEFVVLHGRTVYPALEWRRRVDHARANGLFGSRCRPVTTLVQDARFLLDKKIAAVATAHVRELGSSLSRFMYQHLGPEALARDMFETSRESPQDREIRSILFPASNEAQDSVRQSFSRYPYQNQVIDYASMQRREASYANRLAHPAFQQGYSDMPRPVYSQHGRAGADLLRYTYERGSTMAVAPWAEPPAQYPRPITNIVYPVSQSSGISPTMRVIHNPFVDAQCHTGGTPPTQARQERPRTPPPPGEHVGAASEAGIGPLRIPIETREAWARRYQMEEDRLKRMLNVGLGGFNRGERKKCTVDSLLCPTESEAPSPSPPAVEPKKEESGEEVDWQLVGEEEGAEEGLSGSFSSVDKSEDDGEAEEA